MAKCMLFRQLVVSLCLIVAGHRAESTDNSEVIEYGNEMYSLFERPSANSEVVKVAHETIVMYMDIRAIADQLDQVGKFLRIAYYGLAMHPGLQGKVTTLAIRVTRLGDQSALTIANFKRASNRVLDALESTYWFIYHGKEEVALDMFGSVSRIANQMAEEAMNLHKLYAKEVENVADIIQDTSTTKEHEEHVKVNITLMMNEFETRIKRADTIRKEALSAFHKYEHLFGEARRREHRAIKSQSDPFKKLANSITGFVGFEAFDFQAYKNAEGAYRHEKLRFLEEMEKHRKIKDEALADLAEFSSRVKNSRDDAQLADITIESLKETLGGLKIVANLMLNAASYWQSMHDQCVDTAEMGRQLGTQFDKVMQINAEERRAFWQEDFFKKRALNFYAHWVAIGRVCDESLVGIKPKLQELRDVVMLNPTKEEALHSVRILAKEFSSELAQARRLLEAESQEIKREKDEL